MKKISIKNFRKEIQDYGYNYSVPKFLLSAASVFIILVAAGILYRLDYKYIIAICILSVVCLPVILKANFKNMYEEKRFADLCAYMEQMCSSFAKKNKILLALMDSAEIVDGKLKELILQAIDYIDKCEVQDPNKSVYQEAFEIIEAEYGCKRLYELHRFLNKIEVDGGTYKNALNILLKDIHAWVQRTYIFQKDRKSTRTYYGVGIIISVFLCSLTLFLTKYVDITGHVVYRLSTAIFMLICVFSYALIQKALMSSWIENEVNDALVLSEYDTVVNSSISKIRKKMIPIYAVLVIALPVIYFIMGKSMTTYIILAAIGAILLLMLAVPSIRYRTAYSKTVSALELSFSEWLRDMSLNLQSTTVHMAIQESYDTAPAVLKEPLHQLLRELNENPTGVEPYFNFCRQFNINEISSAMKMLYSLTELGTGDIEESINAIMERNYALIDKAETDVNKSKLTFLKQLISMPLIFVGVKVVIDMLLFITTFMSGNVTDMINQFMQ